MSFVQRKSYIPNPAFETATANSLLKPKKDLVLHRSVGRKKKIGGQGSHRLLTTDGEKFLFLKMNYLKFRVSRARSQKRRESLRAEATAARNEIADCNYGLVVSVANRFAGQLDLDDVISEFCLILLKAIDRFDVARGFKFSTYATHSMQRHVFRLYQRKTKQRTSGLQTQMLEETVPEPVAEETFLTTEPARIESAIQEVEACLDCRERFILRQRYGLDGAPETLRQVAESLGITKERVRQIQVKAIEKIRNAMGTYRIDLPGVG